MKNKILLAIVLIACASVAYAYEPCGVYEETVQPCTPIESVQPCAPIETTVEPCAPIQACAPVEAIQPCAPVADCVGCVGAKTVRCENCPCKLTKVALRRERFERRVRVESSVAKHRCCLTRIFARKNVSIERQVKIETE